MKKLFVAVTMLLMLSSSTFGSTSGIPNSTMIVMKKGATFKLFYRSIEKADVKVVIRDSEQQIVFSEKFKNTDGFIRPYNFSTLPEGSYSIQLTNAQGQQVENVDYIENATKTQRQWMYIKRVPNTQKFVLSIPNKGDEKLNITIYNNEDIVLYEGQEVVSGDFAQLYDLTFDRGPITFVVTDSKGRINYATK